MDRNIHFEKMRETSNIVIPLIKDAYSRIGFQNKYLFDSLNYFVNKRTNINQCLLRPYLVRLGYELSEKSNWVDITYACAALEIFNISTYQSNIAFDGKNGILSNTEKSNQFISSMISLDIAINTILKLERSFGKEVVSLIIDKFHVTNSDIYIGQFYDLNELTIDNINLSISEDDYLAVYLQRCEKLGGSLTSLCFEVGCLLGGGDNDLLNNLRNIGRTLGTAGQMVNDISDFIYSESEWDDIKGYEPSFSDIKAGKVTYPFFHLLRHISGAQREKILNVLSTKQIDKILMEEITKSLCQYGSIEATRQIVLAYYKSLKKEVVKLPKLYTRDLLSVAFSSLLTNKYFAILRNYAELIHE